jgi:hypothetical protein
MMAADQDVYAQGNGVRQNPDGSPTNQALPFALTAFFYPAHMFGLRHDYAFPEGPNVSSSRWDQITSQAKLVTRTAVLADRNEYDIYDMIRTVAKWVVATNPHINDDEPLSVNYKGGPAPVSKLSEVLAAHHEQTGGARSSTVQQALDTMHRTGQ